MSKEAENSGVAHRLSFWKLLTENSVVVPTVQRDYTYGAGTTSTDKVLNKLLQNMYDALSDNVKLKLDFIYGTKDEKCDFSPLDGQQRLTTLFLLHLYAAPLKNLTEKELETLRRFSYATRESSKDFCAKLTDGEFEFEFGEATRPISKQIENKAFFLPSFSDDPTIRSMLVVLDRIHEKFKHLRENGLWSKLVSDNCPIEFDALDFGKYSMSDDLYIKMNARGKPLTEFEIFKSKFEKHIERFFKVEDAADVKKLRDISRWFDVEWADLLLDYFAHGDAKKVDPGFVNLFKNILSIAYWKHTNAPVKEIDKKNWLDPTILESRDDIDFVADLMNIFSAVEVGNLSERWQEVFFSSDQALGIDPLANDGREDRIRLGKLKVDVNNVGDIFGLACRGRLDKTVLLLFYGWYKWLKAGKRNDTSALRHLRNLIENSEHEIRDERMSRLLNDVDLIFIGEILESNADGTFNKNQWIEEAAKAANTEKWRELYRYENHKLLMGAVARFGKDGVLCFDEDNFQWTKKALDGLEYVFASLDDGMIRCALLSNFDYSVSWRTRDSKKRIFGGCYQDWREIFLVKNQVYPGQDKLIEFLHDIARDGQEFLPNNNFVNRRDWRYYFIKTAGKAVYDRTRYGFYWLEDAGKPLEIIALNSSVWGADNLAWRVMHVILLDAIKNQDENLKTEYRKKIGLDKHGAAPLVIGGRVKISIKQNGWAFEDGEDLVAKVLRENGIVIENHTCIAPDDVDMIEYGIEVVTMIVAALNPV